MSYEIVAKVSYNKVDETLTIFSCSNNVWPKTYTYGDITTADDITRVPKYVTTPFEKLMFALFQGLMSGGYQLQASVAPKYRNAYNVTKVAIIDNGEDVWDDYNKEEYFRIFLDVINGNRKPTAGKFIISTDYYNGGIDTFYKNGKGDTRLMEKAKVFKTREEAYLTGVARTSRAVVIELAA